jgi:hypothetical protein
MHTPKKIVEPLIIINGRVCTSSMSGTIRVAINRFADDILENGPGEDEHDRTMYRRYLDRVNEIQDLIFINQPSD